MPELAVRRAIRCRYCGAPIEAGPDDLLVVCRYCGRVNWLRETETPALFIPALSKDELRDRFLETARRDPDLRRYEVDVVRVETVYLPLYEARVDVDAEYEAIVRVTWSETRCGERGCRVVTHTRRVRVDGDVRGVYHGLIPARSIIGEEGVELLAERVLSSRVRLGERVDWNRVDEVLAPELSPEAASTRARGDAAEEAERVARRNAADDALGEVGVVGANARVERISMRFRRLEGGVERLVYTPYTKLYYVAAGGVYRAYLSAWDGYTLLREEPFTPGQRVAAAALSGLLLGGGGAAIGAGLALSAGLALASLLGGLLASIAGGYLLYRVATQPVRLEKGAGGSWFESLVSSMAEPLKKVMSGAEG